MTCKDCIHWDACKNLLEKIAPAYKGKNLVFSFACNHFKNKADYVKVKHGEWIADEKYRRRVGSVKIIKHITYKCSLCGHKSGHHKGVQILSQLWCKNERGAE